MGTVFYGYWNDNPSFARIFDTVSGYLSGISIQKQPGKYVGNDCGFA